MDGSKIAVFEYDQYGKCSIKIIDLNYQLPLFYPDYYLRAIVGITQVRFNGFVDYSVGNTPSFEQKQRSFGGELIFDLRVLRTINMDLKLQFVQRLDNVGDQKPFFFGIGVDYLELLN